jgi:hypothetical protein
MIFKELETKEKFSNKYGNPSYISNYCYYDGTEQISIYIKTGFGVTEKTFNEIISEHELPKWLLEFKNIEEEEEEEEEEEIIIPKKNIIMKENEIKGTNKDDFNSMRNILFESMRMVKDGTLDIEKAKSISAMAQTIINSVKVEVDFLKLTGSSEKPTMIK